MLSMLQDGRDETVSAFSTADSHRLLLARTEACDQAKLLNPDELAIDKTQTTEFLR